MDVGYLLATNLNPKAITGERVKRVAYMILDQGYSAENANTFYRKLAESIKLGEISAKALKKVLNILQQTPKRRVFKETGILETIQTIKNTLTD